jgi:hypothetical protein
MDEDITLAKVDFDRVSWERIITLTDLKVCQEYSWLFADEAVKARNAGDVSGARCYDLLAQITSLRFNLDDRRDPFQPSDMVLRFSPTDFDIFGQIMPETIDAEMRARLADILWLRRSGLAAASSAVQAYCESARNLEDTKTLYCAERVERALQIAQSMGRNHPLVTEVVAYAEEAAVRHSKTPDSRLPAEIMEILQKHRIGDASRLSLLSQKLAEEAEIAHSWYIAGEYWRIKAKWHVLKGDDWGYRFASKNAAETHAKLADDLNASPNPDHATIAGHLRTAIQMLRDLGHERERAEELHKLMLQHQVEIPSQLTRVRTNTGTDMSSTYFKAKRAVHGKSLMGAVRLLAGLVSPVDVVDLEKQVKRYAQSDPMYGVIPFTRINSLGKSVVHIPSVSDPDPEQGRIAVETALFDWASEIQLRASFGVIEPAREQILMEYAVRVDDLARLVWQKPFVPHDHVHLYAQGLFFGLVGDFGLAAHLLVPQLENSVRHLLRGYGINVSTLLANGIQRERNMEETLKLPQAIDVLGADIHFDLRRLFVEHHGLNLRNLLAHGLLADDVFGNLHFVYLWWLALHLSQRYVYTGRGQSSDEDSNS